MADFSGERATQAVLDQKSRFEEHEKRPNPPTCSGSISAVRVLKNSNPGANHISITSISPSHEPKIDYVALVESRAFIQKKKPVLGLNMGDLAENRDFQGVKVVLNHFYSCFDC